MNCKIVINGQEIDLTPVVSAIKQSVLDELQADKIELEILPHDFPLELLPTEEPANPEAHPQTAHAAEVYNANKLW